MKCRYCSDEIKKHIDLKGVPCEVKCDNCLARYSIKPLQDNISGMEDKPILCTDCYGKKKPEDFKPEEGEYCPCCVHHD